MSSPNTVQLVECPRDAMQGLDVFIPTAVKIAYHQELLACGFHTLDVGSFVSPKAIPQLQDTHEVLAGLNMDDTQTELLVIVGNERGAADACAEEKVSYIGFPFSISDTFLRRNINSSIEDSLRRLEAIQNLCQQYGKTLVVYVSMGFGNPYGEPWNVDILIGWSRKLIQRCGASIISLSDTIGTSDPESISYVFKALVPEIPEVNFGAHLHTTPDRWEEKVKAAYEHGCTRFDGAIRGYGGCPMAADRLTGNMPMERLVEYFKEKAVPTGVDTARFSHAFAASANVFP